MNGLVGVWKLIEVRAFDETGQAVPSPFGPQPMGVAIFDAERVMATGGDGRMALSPETKRAFVAYGGKYSFDGAKLVTHVDGASSPDLLEDQVRHIRFEPPTNDRDSYLPSVWSERWRGAGMGARRLN